MTEGKKLPMGNKALKKVEQRGCCACAPMISEKIQCDVTSMCNSIDK